VEGQRIEPIAVGGPVEPPDGVAFLDGIQRYAVEGRFDVLPVVRGHVAAAVLRREGGTLRVAVEEAEEFLVVPLQRLSAEQRGALDAVGLPIHDSPESQRSHPILDVQLSAKVVERRRESLETTVAKRYLAADAGGWLVVDGTITTLGEVFEDHPRVLGLIKSHETQFLDGNDLVVALTLPAEHRTSVFARSAGTRATVYTWYLRLWPWDEQELLHGLVRIERPPARDVVTEATRLSGWLLAERAPLSAPDGRWDRLLYPIHQVETYLRAKAGGWW
jgi:hypothetical protein